MTPATLAQLHALCFQSPPPWSAQSFTALLDSPHVFLIADPGQRAFILGRVIVDEAELLTLATAPEARRSGLARALIIEFDTQALARGATTAFLEVAEDNAPARALYAATGWVQNGRRPGYYVRENKSSVAAMSLCKSLG